VVGVPEYGQPVAVILQVQLVVLHLWAYLKHLKKLPPKTDSISINQYHTLSNNKKGRVIIRESPQWQKHDEWSKQGNDFNNTINKQQTKSVPWV
jgi:hypothetical protein